MRKKAYKRINITLPESTVQILDTVADKGARSSFIDEAIKGHAKEIKQRILRNEVEEGAIVRADRNLQMARDWFQIEEELWQD